jgi:concentrative nucleoside transporter, CNT family
MGQVQGLCGVGLLLLIGFALSERRDRIAWRVIGAGVLLQVIIAVCVLKLGPVVLVFDWIAKGVARVIGFADAGVVFIFGKLGDSSQVWGFVFAVKVLPIIVFFASLMGVLYHLGVMQRVVAGVAWVLRRSLGITGVEALSASANIFVGQTEAPLTVRPYIAGMTRSQLMAVMVGGFATIAGSVMAAYIGMLGDAYATAIGAGGAGRELFAKHLLTASLMSAPAGIVFAKLMLPETESPGAEEANLLLRDERTTANVVDAAAAGAADGLKLALNVAAMLVAFVALLALVNWPLQALGNIESIAAWRAQRGVPEFSLQLLLGWLLTPIAWGMGVAWKECPAVGGLLGTQVIATEFVAYVNLATHITQGTLSPRSAQIVTYALCGFANVASIGIQIGGLSALAPERRSDLAKLAPRAMIAGALACWMTGAIASLFIPA